MTTEEIIAYIECRIKSYQDEIDRKFQYNLEHGCMIPANTEIAKKEELENLLNFIGGHENDN